MLNFLVLINNYHGYDNHYGNLLILATMAILVAMYGFVLWRQQILINLLAIYIAMIGADLLIFNFKDYQLLGNFINLDKAYIIILFFFLFWLMAILILSFSHLIRRINRRYNFIWRWLQALVVGVIHGGLFLSFIISHLPESYLPSFSPIELLLFRQSFSQIVWFILSLLSLLIIRNKRKGPGRPSL